MVASTPLYLALLILIVSSTAYAEDDENRTDADEHRSNTKRTYTFIVKGDDIVIKAMSQSGENKSVLQFRIDLDPHDGPKITAQTWRHTDDSRAFYRFKMMIKRIVEYIPDNTTGFQRGGDDAVVNVYGGDITKVHWDPEGQSHTPAAWNFNDFIEETPENSTDGERVFSATTTDGIFTITFRINPTPSNDSAALPVNLNDIKFDYSVDFDKLQAGGFLQRNDTELGIVGVLQTNLHIRPCENETDTGAACANDVDGTTAGFVRWVNYLDCNGTDDRVNITNTTMEDSDDMGDDEEGEFSEHAKIISWAIVPPQNISGVCVWDPVFYISDVTSGATAAAFSIILMLMVSIVSLA
jgi:hypothetical protein